MIIITILPEVWVLIKYKRAHYMHKWPATGFQYPPHAVIKQLYEPGVPVCEPITSNYHRISESRTQWASGSRMIWWAHCSLGSWRGIQGGINCDYFQRLVSISRDTASWLFEAIDYKREQIGMLPYALVELSPMRLRGPRINIVGQRVRASACSQYPKPVAPKWDVYFKPLRRRVLKVEQPIERDRQKRGSESWFISSTHIPVW